MFLTSTLILSTQIGVALSYHNTREADGKLYRVSKPSTTIPGTSIEYQQNHVCETTPNVTSYSGYVHLSSSSIPDLQGNTPFNISTFFWYFSARHNQETAPLAIYLAGGPGESSTFSALNGESGPCYTNSDGNSTTLNPWSFNEYVNMLYIDQPNFVGFSYDEIVEGVFDVLAGIPVNQTAPANLTIIPGHFASQNPETTANTTTQAAKSLWHFTQVFLAEFEEYHGPKDTVSIWGNSYGGYWTTGTFSYFRSQNLLLANGTLCNTTYRTIHLDTLGITNGCVDAESSVDSWISYPINNTYGIKFYNDSVHALASEALHGPDGCLAQVQSCRALQASLDPGNVGADATVNEACSNATATCFTNVLGPFMQLSNVSQFDIAAPILDPNPPFSAATFLNQKWVQDALGIPAGLNFTEYSKTAENNFFATGDFVVRGIEGLNSLLEDGVKVALVFGDRDWKCNWIGGEQLSLAASYSNARSFRSAGYTPINVNSTYTGGVVRQHEGFSFSRVFDAGHSVSFAQPETVFRIFNRAMFGVDIANGNTSTKAGSEFATKGPGDSWSWTNKYEPIVEGVVCNIRGVQGTCTENQLAALTNGTALVVNDIVIEPKA